MFHEALKVIIKSSAVIIAAIMRECGFAQNMLAYGLEKDSNC